MSYATKVRLIEGGDALDIADGGMITDDGEQAAAIADATAISGGESPTESEHNTVITKLNAVLAALRGVGIIATS